MQHCERNGLRSEGCCQSTSDVRMGAVQESEERRCASISQPFSDGRFLDNEEKGPFETEQSDPLPASGLLVVRRRVTAALLFGYAAYYLCRQNFSLAFGPMQRALGISPLTFGSIASAGTLVYAVGKFTTGSWCDGRGGRFAFLTGLFGSAVLSIALGCSSSVPAFFGLWAANRFFQSMGWGGLIVMMGRWYEPKQYGRAMGVLSVSYQFGAVAATIVIGGLLTLALGWRALFIGPGLLLFTIGLLLLPWLREAPVGSNGLVRTPPIAIHSIDLARHSYLERFRVLLRNPQFLVLCLLSFLLTLLRECFQLWTPVFFLQIGSSASSAAFKSAVFPLLGCVATLTVGWATDRYLDGRRAPVLLGMLATLACGLAALCKWNGLAQSTGLSPSTVAIALMAINGFLLLGPYSIIGGVSALDFGGTQAAGTAAGILDGVGYLGASLAGVGVAALVTSYGWTVAFSTMSGLAVCSALLCLPLWNTSPVAEKE